MYARVTTVQLQPDKAQAGIDLYADSVVPAARRQPGNQGAWLLIDRATGKGVSISLWDSEADMQAGEASGYYQQQLGKFGPLMTAPPVREVYEVAVQGWSVQALTPDPPLANPSETDVAWAVQENLFALFRAMAHALAGAEIVDKALDETLAWFTARQAPFLFWWTGPDTTPADLGAPCAKKWQGLGRIDPVVIERGDNWALLLVDDQQLADLAGLRFNPANTNTLTTR